MIVSRHHPAVGEYSKSVFHNLTATGLSIIDDTLFHDYASMSKCIQQPDLNSKRVIDEEVRHVTVVVRKRFCWLMPPVSRDVSEKEPLLPMFVNLTLSSESTRPRSTMENSPCIVIKQGTGVLGCRDRDVFAVQRPMLMMKVPPMPKSLRDIQNTIQKCIK